MESSYFDSCCDFQECRAIFIDEIDGLEEEYYIEFLNSCGIIEEDVQEKIVTTSRGLPYYLNLSVDIYRNIKGRKPTLDIFPLNP